MGIQINGQTDTITATDGSFTIQGASGNLTGNLTGNVTGNLSGNVSGNVNSTGVSTFATANITQSNPTNLNVTGVTTVTTLNATSIVGVNTVGVVTVYASGSLQSNSIVPVGGIPAGASGGGIIQVVSTTKTDTFSSATSSSAFIDVTGLSVSITPRSTSNKILIYSTVHITGANSLDRSGIRLVRDSTAIAIADAASNRVRASAATINESTNDLHNLNIMHLDSPSTTSATTYKIQCTNESNRNVYINRSNSDSDNNTIFRAVSSITAMEVSG